MKYISDIDNRKILAVIGCLSLIAVVFINSQSNFRGDVSDESFSENRKSHCIAEIDAIESVQTEDRISPIPQSCFKNGEPILNNLSSASPGDYFNHTEDSLEVHKGD